MPNREDNKSGVKSGAAWPLLRIFLFGLAAACILMLAGALLTASGALPESAVSAVPAAAGFAGALWCGRGATRVVGGKALPAGLLSGSAFFFIQFFLGAILYLRWTPGASTLSMMLSCLLGGLAGGLLAATRKKRRAPTNDKIRRRFT